MQLLNQISVLIGSAEIMYILKITEFILYFRVTPPQPTGAVLVLGVVLALYMVLFWLHPFLAASSLLAILFGMNSSPRPFLGLLLVAFLFFSGFAFLQKSRPEGSVVHAIGCSLFDQNGQPLKKYLGWVCAFFPNGHMLMGDGYTLTFYDQKMNVVWSEDAHTHHQINYYPEDKTATVIRSRVVHNDTRIDRLEVYSIYGKLLKAFNFELKHSLHSQDWTWDHWVLPKVKKEATLINSFHRIGENQSEDPALKEGNYLVQDVFGMLYIFNNKLNKIIKTVDLRKLKRHSMNDLQVTKEGFILAYHNRNQAIANDQSYLEVFELDSGESLWTYGLKPTERFYGPYEGNVQKLPNGNFLFSYVNNEIHGTKRTGANHGIHRAIEVSQNGERVWEMHNQGEYLSGKPNVVKRLDLSSYLRHKGNY